MNQFFCIFQVYDLFMTAVLLLTLLLYMPHVKWAEEEHQPFFYASHVQGKATKFLQPKRVSVPNSLNE
jgi:hypothetical protein